MKKRIRVKPVHQPGNDCKITAIAAIEQYYAEQLGFEPIPLHKKKIAPLSIRQLAKKQGSVQGELLELDQFSPIFSNLGYEIEIVDIQDNYSLFKHQVTDQINKGNLILACFAVNSETGSPTTQYEPVDNEHAAILHGFNDETEELDFTHWDANRKTGMKDFYDSSMALLKQRAPEYYVNIKSQDKEKKYDLLANQNGLFFSPEAGDRKSIVPRENSGFRGKLIVIKQPELQPFLEARQKLFTTIEAQQQVLALLSELKIKTTQLIQDAEKNHKYKKVSQVAKELNLELDEAKKAFLMEGTIDLEDFKERCNKAIEKAEPEFKKHRGWYGVNIILRKILGVLAHIFPLASLIPGYQKTFFQTPKTDSEEQLESFKHKINQLNR